jgi:hypothetical protein
MQVAILGTRDEVDRSVPCHSRHSGVLIDGILLLDIGEREYLGLAITAGYDGMKILV